MKKSNFQTMIFSMIFVLMNGNTYRIFQNTLNYFQTKKKQTYCGFSMGSNQYWAGNVCDLCVYFMTGTPEGSTESGCIEKPGIEPATPGLQVIGLSPTPRRLHKPRTKGR